MRARMSKWVHGWVGDWMSACVRACVRARARARAVYMRDCTFAPEYAHAYIYHL